jgi:hypothetical protein
MLSKKSCVRSKFVVKRLEQQKNLTIFSFIRTNEALVRGTDCENCLCARIAQNATSKNGVSLLGLLRREMSILLIRDIDATYMNFRAGDVCFSQLNRCNTYYRVLGLESVHMFVIYTYGTP